MVKVYGQFQSILTSLCEYWSIKRCWIRQVPLYKHNTYVRTCVRMFPLSSDVSNGHS